VDVLIGEDSMAKSDPKYIRDFKALLKGDVNAATLANLEAELYGASDRARAVLLASFVENALERYLKTKLRPTFPSSDYRHIFGFEAPLGSFSAKIKVAFAFNWYGPDTLHDLDLIRELRNGFAHSRNTFEFVTPEIAAVCRELRAPDSPGSFIPPTYLATVDDEKLRDASDKKHPRTRFLSACHTISERLLSNSGVSGISRYILDLP
jgi:hypothetical protein